MNILAKIVDMVNELLKDGTLSVVFDIDGKPKIKFKKEF